MSFRRVWALVPVQVDIGNGSVERMGDITLAECTQMARVKEFNSREEAIDHVDCDWLNPSETEVEHGEHEYG